MKFWPEQLEGWSCSPRSRGRKWGDGLWGLSARLEAPVSEMRTRPPGGCGRSRLGGEAEAEGGGLGIFTTVKLLKTTRLD